MEEPIGLVVSWFLFPSVLIPKRLLMQAFPDKGKSIGRQSTDA